jgi:aspartate carbamoyltransferase regulatory subunit
MPKAISLENGVVLDHLRPGNGLRVLNGLSPYLGQAQAVLLVNVFSRRCGSKDMIQLTGADGLELDLVGLIAPETTVNVISAGKVVRKQQIGLPRIVQGAFSCSNPCCISNSDCYAKPLFRLVNADSKEYICPYCEEITQFHR